MDVCRKIWVVAVLATVGTLSAANLCTWTGGAGDQITGGKSSGQVVKFAEAGRTGYWYCAQRGTMFIFR